MKTFAMRNLTGLGATMATLLFAVFAPASMRAQGQSDSKYANDTFNVISRSDGGHVVMHLDGEGDHCWATSSEDRTVGVSMGDKMCTLWNEVGEDEGGYMHAKVTPNQITFHLNGKSYSVSDASTVKRARSLFDPLVSIEEQQNALGDKQRGLGEKQRDLGEQQREVKVQVPDMGADFKKVEADAKRLSVEGGTQSDLGDLQSELGDLQSQLGDLQSQAGDMQSKLGDKQSELGNQQSALGDQQSALGDKGERMAPSVAQKLRDILSQSIQNGTAKAE